MVLPQHPSGRGVPHPGRRRTPGPMVAVGVPRCERARKRSAWRGRQSGGLFTKGWLPYTLRWSFRVTRAEFPHGFALEALGDFIGTGVWAFEQEGPDCLVTYDWQISAAKPLLRRLSGLLRGIFSANHEWAMRQGKISLDLELRRYRGELNVPAPPGPTWPHNWLNNKIL